MSSYTLYYAPGTCSLAVHVLLNELNADFDLKKSSIHGSNPDQDLLAVNPRGQVPVLVHNGQPLIEGGAILTYLCDTDKNELLPQQGWERAKALQYLMFANATLHTAYSKAMFLKKNSAPQTLMDKALDDIQALWNYIEDQIASNGGQYICGDSYSPADILITVIANWLFLPRDFDLGSKTKALIAEVSKRPAFQKALESESVQYKAAA